MKYLYLYKDGESRQVSAKTRSWEKAEERAHEIRDSWNPVRQLERQLQAKVRQSETKQISLVDAVGIFLKEVERLNREESTRGKYRLTLEDRLLGWCAAQKPPIVSLTELDVETRWLPQLATVRGAEPSGRWTPAFNVLCCGRTPEQNTHFLLAAHNGAGPLRAKCHFRKALGHR